MKTKYFTVIIFLFLVSSCLFIGCVDDSDNNVEEVNLDINHQIVKTRNTNGDGIDFIQGYNDRYNQNTKVPGYANECGLYTITKLWIKKMGREAFERELDPMNAEDFYNELRQNINNDDSYQWTIGSDSMRVDEWFQIASQTHANGSPLVTDYKLFNNQTEMQRWLSDSGNRKKIVAVIMQNSNGFHHIAQVTSISKASISFSGYNESTNNYSGGKTYYNSVIDKKTGEPKKGMDCDNQTYYVVGVVY